MITMIQNQRSWVGNKSVDSIILLYILNKLVDIIIYTVYNDRSTWRAQTSKVYNTYTVLVKT